MVYLNAPRQGGDRVLKSRPGNMIIRLSLGEKYNTSGQGEGEKVQHASNGCVTQGKKGRCVAGGGRVEVMSVARGERWVPDDPYGERNRAWRG